MRGLTKTWIGALLSTVILVSSVHGQSAPDAPPILCSFPPDGRYWDGPIVRVAISENGALRWNGHAVSPAVFAEYLADVESQSVKPAFHFDAAPQTTYATVVPVVLQVQEAGVGWMWLGVQDAQHKLIACDVPRNRTGDSVFVDLTVKNDGGLEWNATPITEMQFSQYMAEAGGSKPQPAMSVMPGPNTRYGRLMSIVSVIYRSGIHGIAIASSPRKVKIERSKNN